MKNIVEYINESLNSKQLGDPEDICKALNIEPNYEDIFDIKLMLSHIDELLKTDKVIKRYNGVKLAGYTRPSTDVEKRAFKDNCCIGGAYILVVVYYDHPRFGQSTLAYGWNNSSEEFEKYEDWDDNTELKLMYEVK